MADRHWHVYRSEDGSFNLSIYWTDGRFLLSFGPRVRDSGWSLVRRDRPPLWGGLWTWSCLDAFRGQRQEPRSNDLWM
jgi:hypothetical protein